MVIGKVKQASHIDLSENTERNDRVCRAPIAFYVREANVTFFRELSRFTTLGVFDCAMSMRSLLPDGLADLSRFGQQKAGLRRRFVVTGVRQGAN
ncbi:hypothetical protein DWU99_13660 [Dyella psychrodurans]|uniref:Uncharacterized protein n=1 Tax=Dyella psychrodurans TaxID=1927960 RepID=A0A370X230_9GAMM|nr:hypothetical protein DWU99_13660 [Dyella psychrodurans]